MAKQEAKVTFEQALEKLGEIVHRLEEGQMGLEESLASYEEGVGLLKQCHALLEKAEKKIRLLSGLDEEGKPILEPFDGTASLERDHAARGRPEKNDAARGNRRRRAAAEEDEGAEGPKGLF